MKLLENIFDRTLSGLSKSMELSWKRNQALTANIANAETPMYRAVDVNFARELEQAFGKTESSMKLTDPNHLQLSSEQGAHIVADESGVTKQDGNNVDLDHQMGRLATNSGDYINAAKLIRRQIGLIRSAIRTGER